MRNFTIGRYLPFNSLMHRIDPRVKLLGMIALMVAVFISTSFWVYGFIGIFILILLKLSKLSIKSTLKSLKLLWVMFTILTIMNVFMYREPGFTIPFTNIDSFTIPFVEYTVYLESIVRTLFIVVRIAMMISISSILTATTKPLDLTLGLESLMFPLKPFGNIVHIFAMMISIALRSIPTLIEETEKIMKAQASRGLDIENGKLKDKVRGVVALIIPLLVSSFHLASDMGDAMEVRGYDPKAKRTRYRILTIKYQDVIATIIVAAILTTVILYNQGIIPQIA